MMFNSLSFFIFLPLVTFLYFQVKYEYRWIILLVASYYFYFSSGGIYTILLVISTLIDYISGLQIYNAKTSFRKNLFLMFSLVGNFGLLFSFKYFNFFNSILHDSLGIFAIEMPQFALDVILPVGISFYTFQTLSYTIDIYKGELKPTRHLGIFALFVTYFPQLVAGPIERATNLLPQFFEKHDFDYLRAVEGLKLILWGLFKKVVVADTLATTVSLVYNNPTSYTGFSLWLATIFFAYQIFCDFSGYTDIAIGAAEIMGFRLMNNFRRPYFSRSISEFWKRWHISLSTWFRDYLYIPLGGNRVSVPRWYFNLFFTFLVSGLWHGANWTFVIWGALHGFYLIFEIVTKSSKEKLLQITHLIKFPQLIQFSEIAITFVLVNLGWIFFRANSLNDAIYILSHLFSGLSFSTMGVNLGFSTMSDLLKVIVLILIVEFVHLMQESGIGIFLVNEIIERRPRLWLRWSMYYIIIFAIVLLGVFGEVQFIYFQF